LARVPYYKPDEYDALVESLIGINLARFNFVSEPVRSIANNMSVTKPYSKGQLGIEIQYECRDAATIVIIKEDRTQPLRIGFSQWLLRKHGLDVDPILKVKFGSKSPTEAMAAYSEAIEKYFPLVFDQEATPIIS
jgi:hypothetical protein